MDESVSMIVVEEPQELRPQVLVGQILMGIPFQRPGLRKNRRSSI